MAQFEDEILIKDATGRFKVLRSGRIYDLEEIAPKPAVLPVLEIVKRIIKESKIVFEKSLQKRFEEIIEACLRDVRDKFETKNTLIQPKEKGGMGFAAEQADLIIKLILKAKTEEVKREKGLKVEREEAVKPAPKLTPPPSLPVEEKVLPKAPTAVPMTPGLAEFVFSPADEQEILAHKEKLPVLLAGLKPIEIAKFINEIIRESGLVLDATNQKKLENILLTHLKDIRDGYETRATLLYAPEPAGLGLKEEQIEKILSAARKKISALEEQLKKEEEERTRKAMEEEKQRIDLERKKAEEKVKEKIDVRWAEITGQSAESAPVVIGSELLSPPLALRPKASVPLAPVSPGIIKIAEAAPAPPPKVLPSLPAKPSREAPTAPKVLPKPPLPSPPLQAPKPEPTLEKATTPPIPPKIKPLEILKPAPPTFRRPEVPSKKPRLEDIKVRPRLIGPVEEIREMTLVDFRQLAKEPREATQKILDKLNLLERESLTKKIDGIRAWQQSEVNKLYLEIIRESLTKSAPVSRIIAERLTAGKQTLTESEYRAVMELNRVLRY